MNFSPFSNLLQQKSGDTSGVACEDNDGPILLCAANVNLLNLVPKIFFFVFPNVHHLLFSLCLLKPSSV